ncbi:MAG: ABC transporter ATP-binding protein/permease [Acholeplasmatales bacterium]|jgi:ATP-binding cassette subfamily B protein|nr:ABC transporter ATP-binding protein/permease [Acholeplasmatales bacterium]
MGFDFDEENDLKYKLRLTPWKKIFSILMRSKKQLIITAISCVFVSIFDAMFQVIDSYIIDTIYVHGNYSFLNMAIILLLSCSILSAFTVWCFLRFGGRVAIDISFNIRNDCFKKLQQLPFSYYDKTPHGWIMGRMTSDVRNISDTLSWGIIDFILLLFTIVFCLIVMFILNVKLALIALISIPLMVLVAFLFKKIILSDRRKTKKYNSIITGLYNEAFLGAKTSKSLVIEDKNYRLFSKETRNLKSYGIKAAIHSNLLTAIIMIIGYFFFSVILVDSSKQILSNLFGTGLSLGTMTLFLNYMIKMMDYTIGLTDYFGVLQSTQASVEKVAQLLDADVILEDKQEIVSKYGDLFNPKFENWEEIKGDISFNDVTFYYKEDEIVLNKFNLDIKANSSVAIVGHTGSGKSTIVNLLCRFYEPVSGVIKIDGVDYKERSINFLHKRLGYVLQTPHLFSTTIIENMRYGNLNATDDEIISVCKSIGIDEMISSLENGYNTEVQEGGNRLSMGQKQLISFARALIANPRILVFDEATSSIDSLSEEIIQKATAKLFSGRTSIIVAHRLSTIINCDLIVVLDKGEIKEKGTHEELLRNKKEYYNLYKSQFIKEIETKYSDE